MKKIYIILTTLIMLVGFSSCENYLDRQNLDTFDDENFWTSESNMRLFAHGAYNSYFNGYGYASAAFNRFFTSSGTADEHYNTGLWTTNTPSSVDAWTFTRVRRHNVMINRVDRLPESDDVKAHWRGVARFFRAKEYANLCLTFGDMPWIDKELVNADIEIMYKDRDPIAFVATKIIEDYEYAAANVRLNDGVDQINRYVVMAFMSRDLLYLGSVMKYHKNDAATANTLFAKAKWAAEQVMAGPYAIEDDLRGIFTQDNYTLGSTKEVILRKAYITGTVTHSLVTYSTTESQPGIGQRAVNAFLASDGLPIKQSPLYNYSSDNNIRLYTDMYQNRDPRMAATLCDTLRINGVHTGFAHTGVCVWKFVPYVYNSTQPIYQGAMNTTDAPIIRLGEVLLNYAEAAAELGQFDQAAADNSINKLRNRTIKLKAPSSDGSAPALTKLPPMTISGDNVLANGVVVNDPDRDPSVSSILWEIRRERWVELMQEGFRREDLHRWKMFKYMNNTEVGTAPSEVVMGGIFDYMSYSPSDRSKIKTAVGANNLYVFTPGDSTKVALNPIKSQANRRNWIEGDSFYERQYWTAVPTNEITTYENKGYTLTQNPGW